MSSIYNNCRGLIIGIIHIVLIFTVQCLQCRIHSLGKTVRFFLADKIQAIDLTIVSPLVKRRRCLVVLQALEYGTIDDHLSKKNSHNCEQYPTTTQNRNQH